MKILRNIQKNMTQSISVLTKIIGVSCTVYFPTETQKASMHYVRDNNIEYQDLPGYKGKLLIPKIVRNRINSIQIIDDYEDDAIILFTSVDLVFPKYSKVIVDRPDGSIENFIINEVKAIKDDERVFFYKYFLVPDTEIDVKHNRENLIKLLDDAYTETGNSKVDESMPLKKVHMDTSKIKYDPIE